MIQRKLALVLIGLFLVGFSAFKYLSAAPDGFSSSYLISVAILVALTGAIPLCGAVWLAKLSSNTGVQWAIAILSGVVLCCAGYATYWALFISPTGADVPLMAVASRGIYAGPIEGVLAALLATARKA